MFVFKFKIKFVGVKIQSAPATDTWMASTGEIVAHQYARSGDWTIITAVIKND